MTKDAALVEQLMMDFRQAVVSASDRAMLEYAAKLTQQPWNVVEADVMALSRGRLQRRGDLDINQITSYYAFVNRLADGLGVELEEFWKNEKR